ncbi:MAG TPA: type VI secretion system ImpA family N-terminal domain-containing protein, partial [Rhodocyclaceae bacterium]|nr:type VI secretion system ImpA family N-terminal domain-containing protein [Rhodocyclaceae bacterium]
MEDKDRKADRYFMEVVEMDLQTLLAPIPGENAYGISASHDESYRRIRHEREDEDPSLPLGPWERELKRANWVAASDLAAKALATRSKDLQLAVWLFEALIARSGFQSLAPCLHLIDQLFRRFGSHLHPHDSEHRVNLLLWVNQKLLSPLRKVQITATGGENNYAWNDWEQAQRNEQLRASLGKQAQAEIEGATLTDVGAALACTSYERIAFLQTCLSDGQTALKTLEKTVDEVLHGDGPGFGAMRGLLERIEVV